jgi:hypothetical protein
MYRSPVTAVTLPEVATLAEAVEPPVTTTPWREIAPGASVVVVVDVVTIVDEVVLAVVVVVPSVDEVVLAVVVVVVPSVDEVVLVVVVVVVVGAVDGTTSTATTAQSALPDSDPLTVTPPIAGNTWSIAARPAVPPPVPWATSTRSV